MKIRNDFIAMLHFLWLFSIHFSIAFIMLPTYTCFILSQALEEDVLRQTDREKALQHAFSELLYERDRLAELKEKKELKQQVLTKE